MSESNRLAYPNLYNFIIVIEHGQIPQREKRLTARLSVVSMVDVYVMALIKKIHSQAGAEHPA